MYIAAQVSNVADGHLVVYIYFVVEKMHYTEKFEIWSYKTD